MLNNLGKYTFRTTANGNGSLTNRNSGTDSNRRYSSIANSMPSPSGGSSMNSNVIGLTNVNINLLDGIISQDEISLRRIFRDMYYHDNIAGAYADLLSNMPFSDFSLSGVKDVRRLRKYQQSVENLSLKTLLPNLSIDYLALGIHVSMLEFNDEEKLYSGIFPLNIDDLNMKRVPLYDVDPLIDYKLPADLKASLTDLKDPRLKKYQKFVPQFLKDGAKKGGIQLDPNSTIYIPRRTYSYEYKGTSIFRRILPIFLIEKALMKGTIDQSYRRQRAILHLMCITGDTLIGTENGLQRIDKLVNHDVNDEPFSKKLILGVKGYDGKKHYTKAWHYRGEKETIKITTESGFNLSCTPDHKIMVLTDDFEFEKIEAQYLKNRYVCIPTTDSIGENNKLKLIPYEFSGNYNHSKKYLPPIKMTPKLGYILGALSGDGTICTNTMRFLSKDKKCAKIFRKRFDKVFGTESTLDFDKYTDCWGITQNSVAISNYLSQLGLYIIKKRVKIGKHSHRRIVPKSILKADRQSKLAYIAGYLDTDGTVTTSKNQLEMRFTSVSKKLLHVLKIMLQDIGYLSFLGEDKSDTSMGYLRKYFLHINTSIAPSLYREIEPYIADSRRKVNRIPENNVATQHGIPVIPIINALDRRKTTNTPIGCRGIGCKIYLKDDSGNSIVTKYPYGATTDDIKKRDILSYNDRSGLLEKLYSFTECSKKLRVKIKRILKAKYKFEKVIKIKNNGIKPVYDLSMEKGVKNLFVANGLAIKNCGDDEWEPLASDLDNIVNLFLQADLDPVSAIVATRQGITANELKPGDQFWKSPDIHDWSAAVKMRALGINDGFLSGEANYSTLNATLTVFVEQLRSYREMITRKLFYERIFPNIAKENDFRKFAKQNVETGSLEEELGKYSHNYGKSNIFKERNGTYTAICSGDMPVKANSLDEDLTKYEIPEVHWHKQLKPESDNDYLQILDTLEQKGVPVPIRMLAAAGGIDLNTVMQQLDDDLKLREKIADYLQEKREISEPTEDQSQEGQETSSLANFITKSGSLENQHLLGRNTNVDERLKAYNVNSVGKRIYTTEKGSKTLEKKLHKKIAEACSNMAKKYNHTVKNREK